MKVHGQLICFAAIVAIVLGVIGYFLLTDPSIDPVDEQSKDNPTKAIAFAPNGQMLALANFDRAVTIIDLKGERKDQVLQAHSGGVFALAFSPSGKLLAAAGNDEIRKRHADGGVAVTWLPRIIIWETGTWKKKMVLHAMTLSVDHVEFLGDDTRLVNGRHRGVQVWDLATGKEIQKIHGTENFTAVACSRDGNSVVTGSPRRGLIQIWDPRTGAELRQLQADDFLPDRGNGIESLAISSDNRTIAAKSANGPIRLWDVNGQRKGKLMSAPSRASWLAFFSNGRRLLVTGRRTEVWDLQAREGTGPTYPGIQGRDCAFSSDGQLVAIIQRGKVAIFKTSDLIERGR